MGEKPGGVGARTVQVTATVTKVDQAAREVALRGAKGKTVTLEVEDPDIDLAKVKKGDLVEVTYTEAMGISVERR